MNLYSFNDDDNLLQQLCKCYGINIWLLWSENWRAGLEYQLANCKSTTKYIFNESLKFFWKKIVEIFYYLDIKLNWYFRGLNGSIWYSWWVSYVFWVVFLPMSARGDVRSRSIFDAGSSCRFGVVSDWMVVDFGLFLKLGVSMFGFSSSWAIFLAGYVCATASHIDCLRDLSYGLSWPDHFCFEIKNNV